MLYDICCNSALQLRLMPRYVDHAARRRHVAATAAELVGTHGLDALTFRNVADAAGCSTTVVTHYFADKRDLLLSTFREVADRLGARFDEAQRHRRGLRGCLEALLPLDAAPSHGMAPSDLLLGCGDQRPRVRRRGCRPCPLGAGADQGAAAAATIRTWSTLELDVVSRRLVTIVHGLGAQSALDPDHWSAAQQRRVLAHELGCSAPRAPAR